MKYELKEIQTFIYVAKLKSFSKTAKILNLSNAIITNRISNLENDLKISLLNRSPRQVELTNEGKELLKFFEDIIAKVEILDNFTESKKLPEGKLKIAIPPYFSRYHIVPYLKDFFEQYPKIDLDITLTENPIDLVTEGYDLQIRIQIPEEEDLEVAHISDNQKLLCASKKYIEKYSAPKSPQDLLKHNCIIFGENNKWRFKHKKTNEKITLENMTGNIKCDNGEIIKELILSGLGITIKSEKDVTDELKSGEIIKLLSDYEIEHKTKFYIVYPHKKYNSQKVKAFIEFFKKKLS